MAFSQWALGAMAEEAEEQLPATVTAKKSRRASSLTAPASAGKTPSNAGPQLPPAFLVLVQLPLRLLALALSLALCLESHQQHLKPSVAPNTFLSCTLAAVHSALRSLFGDHTMTMKLSPLPEGSTKADLPGGTLAPATTPVTGADAGSGGPAACECPFLTAGRIPPLVRQGKQQQQQTDPAT